MELTFEPARRLAGEVAVPGDKSITHRAYLLGALARGHTRIAGVNRGRDCEATLDALRSLGVTVARGPDDLGGESDLGAEPGSAHPVGGSTGGEPIVVIEGRPNGFSSPSGPLDLGNSGTGLRLLAGALAGSNVAAVLTGDDSLRSRPMDRIVQPLRAMGAQIDAQGEGGRAPLVVRGAALENRRLEGASLELPVASAQVKSCLLLAGLKARGRTTVREPRPSRDHTERLLPRFGAAVERGDACTVSITGPAELRAADLRVPGDFSAAFFWLVAGTLVEEGRLVIRGVGVNPTRTGALDVLRRMGARVALEDAIDASGEPVADLVVEPASLIASDVAPEEVPSLVDELPALAVAQAFARGRSRVAGAGELRAKESDRIASMAVGLRALGIGVEERPDGWIVEGGAIRGGTCESRGDHRVAMALGVAGLAAREPVRILDAEMIDTSYPGFYSALRDRVTSR